MFSSCEKDTTSITELDNDNAKYISSIGISNYPEIFNSNPTSYDLEGNQNDFLNTLKEDGINTTRLGLWVNPSNFPNLKNEWF